MIRILLCLSLIFSTHATFADETAAGTPTPDAASVPDITETIGEGELGKYKEFQAAEHGKTTVPNPALAVSQMISYVGKTLKGHSTCTGICGPVAAAYVDCSTNAFKDCGYEQVEGNSILCTKQRAVRVYKPEATLPTDATKANGYIEFVCGYTKYCASNSDALPTPFIADRLPDKCWFPAPLPDLTGKIADVPTDLDATKLKAYPPGSLSVQSQATPAAVKTTTANDGGLTPQSTDTSTAVTPVETKAAPIAHVTPAVAANTTVVKPEVATDTSTSVLSPDLQKQYAGQNVIVRYTVVQDPPVEAPRKRTQHKDDNDFDWGGITKYIAPVAIGVGVGAIGAFFVDKILESQAQQRALASVNPAYTEFPGAPAAPFFAQQNPYGGQLPASSYGTAGYSPNYAVSYPISQPSNSGFNGWSLLQGLNGGASPVNPFAVQGILSTPTPVKANPIIRGKSR